MLIVREYNFGFVRMISDNLAVLTNSALDTGLRTLHSTINADKDAVYLAYMGSSAIEIVK